MTNEDQELWQQAMKLVAPLGTPQSGGASWASEQLPSIKLDHDLHGKTLQAAYDYMVDLIDEATSLDVTMLRIITGKSGELNRQFPLWMKSPRFKTWIRSATQESTGGSWLLRL